MKVIPVIGNRLQDLRKQKGLKKKDVAEYLGVTNVSYGRYEAEERNIPFEHLTKLADFYGVSVDYLLGRSDAGPFLMKHQRLIPVYRSVYACCGNGLCNEYLDDLEVEQYLPLPDSALKRVGSERIYGIHVEGRSMEQAGITEDCIAIVNENIEPYNGAPCYVTYEIGGEYRDAIKFWHRDRHGKITLKASSPVVDDIVFEPDDEYAKLTVRGVIVKLVKLEDPIENW